jgi:hypothetical protein
MSEVLLPWQWHIERRVWDLVGTRYTEEGILEGSKHSRQARCDVCNIRKRIPNDTNTCNACSGREPRTNKSV